MAADVGALLPGFSDFRILGRGSMSTVYQAVHAKTQLPVAVKHLHLDAIAPASRNQLFELETNVMDTVNHPFIVKFFDVVGAHGDFFVVMEYASNGSLPITMQ
jgi:serine/threonine-protein kinase ULK/ATG1